MAGLSLRGYEAGLARLADTKAMPSDQLDTHIDELTSLYNEAKEKKIGRQVEVASRLLTHYQFEQGLRGAAVANAALVQEAADSASFVGSTAS